jgi:hypothetical protein
VRVLGEQYQRMLSCQTVARLFVNTPRWGQRSTSHHQSFGPAHVFDIVEHRPEPRNDDAEIPFRDSTESRGLENATTDASVIPNNENSWNLGPCSGKVYYDVITNYI